MRQDLDQGEWRPKIVAEAKKWIGTPYQNCGTVRGPRGGTDCAMLLVCVYADLGLIPKEFDPRPYSPQWHVHRNEEKYIDYISSFVKEIEGPPGPGDVAMFKIGRVFAHGAIVVEWPLVIHAEGGAAVLFQDISKNVTGKRALANVPRRFFSLWG